MYVLKKLDYTMYYDMSSNFITTNFICAPATIIWHLNNMFISKLNIYLYVIYYKSHR